MATKIHVYDVDMLKKILPWMGSIALLFCTFTVFANSEIRVGSKRFTESYILAEIIAQKLESNPQLAVVRKPGLGNTGILFSALKQGDIDIYPEYMGTITQEILHRPGPLSLTEVNALLKPSGIQAGVLLGFNNSYGLAMRTDLANAKGIHTITDLITHPELRVGLSHEFLARQDGWRGLGKAYSLPRFQVRGLDHGLSYAALYQNQIDLIDVYTTDSNLSNPQLTLLQDDRQFFPSYEALLLYREKLTQDPAVMSQLAELTNGISLTQMQAMNQALESQSQTAKQISAQFLNRQESSNLKPNFWSILFGPDLLTLTLQHTFLVLTSLILAIMIGIPLGSLVFQKPIVGYPILQVAGVLQTIPSLALLTFLIFMVHSIGALPAIIALTLYALLPIIENTNTGLKNVNRELKEAAAALGASRWKSFVYIEIPQSMPSIFGGIKIAAITATGTATLAAFVGAGGYGQRIAEGLAVNNNEVMLSGAIPAAVFAIVMQIFITLIERKFRFTS